MKKAMIVVILICCLTITSLPVHAAVRIPDSVSYNGRLPDGTSIFEEVSANPAISPLAVRAYKMGFLIEKLGGLK